MKLRPYQQKLVGQTLESLKRHDKVLVQLATGGGKTPIAAYLARLALDRGVPVLFVAHREELLLQAGKKLAEQGVTAGMIKAGFEENRRLPCQIGSIQSLGCRELPPAGLVIIDEAHRSISSSYLSLSDQYRGSKIVGLTATPYRLDGTGLGTVFDVLHCGPSVKWLIQNGYLAPYRAFVADRKIDTSKVRTIGGDYSVSGLAKAANKASLRGDLVSHWQKYANGKKTLVFAVTVDHSKAIAAQYCAAGIPAEHLDGKTPDRERESILRRFEQGKTLVLCNVEIATEGFDLPDLDCVQLARPTKSLSLALQMIGRALRMAPGKTSAIILDHAGIIAEHGYPVDYRDWSLDGNPLPQKSTFKRCKRCSSAIKRAAKTCPSCGYQYQQSARALFPLHDEADLIEDWNPTALIPTFEQWQGIDCEQLELPWEEAEQPQPLQTVDRIADSVRSSLAGANLPDETVERIVAAAVAEALRKV